MMFPTIATQAINVELTDAQVSLITRKLAPLARLLPSQDDVRFDVVLRRLKRRWSGDMYCLSVRMIVPTHTYYAVATEQYFARAFTKVREDLRRSVSKHYRADEYNTRRMQQFMRERQYLELFA